MSFSLAPPPASGKVSRREKVSRSGRSTSFDADELARVHATTPTTPAGGQFPTISENPFESATRNTSNTKNAPVSSGDFFSSTPSPAVGSDDLFSFFDPLADKSSRPTPAAAPASAPAQRAQPPADPFSAAFASQVSVSAADQFDPFASFTAAQPTPPAAQQKAAPKQTKAPAAKQESSDESSDDSSDDSSDESDSDSDDDEPPRAASSAARSKQLASKSTVGSASSAAATSNKPLASGAPASIVPGQPPVIKVDALDFMHKGHTQTDMATQAG